MLFQERKDQIAAKYQKNKTEIAQKKMAYERTHIQEISKRKAEYYQDNKEDIARKYKRKKATQKALKKAEEEANESIETTKEKFRGRIVERNELIWFKDIFCKSFLENIENCRKQSTETKSSSNMPNYFQLEQDIGNIQAKFESKIDEAVDAISKCTQKGEIEVVKKKLVSDIGCEKFGFICKMDTTLRETTTLLKLSYKCPTCIRFNTVHEKNDIVCEKCELSRI